jgi:hypothetical protein
MPGTFEENRREMVEAMLRIHQNEEMRNDLLHQVFARLREREGIDAERTPGYNPRLAPVFGPSLGDPDFEGSVAEFAWLYYGYGRGTPEERAPFLEHIFKRFDEAVLDLDPDHTEDLAARYEEMREPCQALVCYEEVQRLHPEEFAARYDTPAKRQALDAKIDLAAVQFAYLRAYARVYGVPAQIASEAQMEAVCAEPAVSDPNAQQELALMGNKLRMARDRQRILKDVSAGRDPAPIRLRVTRETAAPDQMQSAPAAFHADRLRRSNPRGARTREAENAAVALFDNTFGELLDPAGVIMRNAGEIGITDPFQLIYIDGRPAAEVFAERTANMNPEERAREMRVAATGAMLSGSSRLEVASVAHDANGELQVKATPVRPDVRAVQPTAKEEGHGWLRRAFNWGPFKIPTRQDKLDTLERDDPQRNRRQSAITGQVKDKALNEELRQMEIQREATRQTRERVHRLAQETIQQYGADRLEPLIYGLVSLVDVGREDKRYETEFEGLGRLPDGRKIVSTLNRAPSRVSFAMLCLLAEGHNLNEMDPNTEQGQALLKHGGERALALLKAAREDPSKVDQVYQMGIDGMKQLLREPYPDVDPANPESVARAAGRADLIATLGQDVAQFYSGAQMNAYSSEYAGLVDQLGGLANHMHAIRCLGEYYASDLYKELREPEGRERKLVYEALRAQRVLDRVRPQEPGRALGDVSASIGGMMEVNYKCDQELQALIDPQNRLGMVMRLRSFQDPAPSPVRREAAPARSIGPIEVNHDAWREARALQGRRTSAAPAAEARVAAAPAANARAATRATAAPAAEARAGAREHTSYAEMAPAQQGARHGQPRQASGRDENQAQAPRREARGKH